MSLGKKQLLFYAVAVVLSVDFALFGYSPSARRLKELRESENAVQQVVAQSRIQQRRLIAMQPEFTAQEGLMRRWFDRVPPAPNVGHLLESLAGVISRCGLADVEITPGPIHPDGPLSWIPIEVSGRGTWPQVVRCLDGVKTTDRLIRIEAVDGVREGDGMRPVRVTMRLLAGYGRPDEGAATQWIGRTKTDE